MSRAAVMIWVRQEHPGAPLSLCLAGPMPQVAPGQVLTLPLTEARAWLMAEALLRGLHTLSPKAGGDRG